MYFATSLYPHLELNKDGTSYFIRCGLPMPRWYRPELLVGPARATAPAVPNPAAPEYRAAYAVHSAALPCAATPALPAPPDPTPAVAPTAPGSTRCVQQLTWTPSIIVMELGASEGIVSMALHSATSAARDGHQTPGSQQSQPERAAPSRPEEASAKGGTETGAVPTTTVAETGGSRDARTPAVRQVTANSGRRVVSGSACDAANVMVVRRDTADTQQFPGSSGGASKSTRRLFSQDFRPAHTRAVALLDGSRCTVIIDTGADVSLVSACVLRPGAKYLAWSERDGRITGVAQQGIAILEFVVSEVRLGPVRALTPLVVALGVGFDAILGVDFLHEHGISVNLAQHCLVFEAQDGLIVPLVGHHPRFKHACALTYDVALYPRGCALVPCACEPSERRVGPPRAHEVCLIAARSDQKLGLVVPEQLTTGFIEVQSAADCPLYLPAGWEVAKVRDCPFVPYGPPRLVLRQQRIVVNLVSADRAGESPALQCSGPSRHIPHKKGEPELFGSTSRPRLCVGDP